MQLHEYMCPDPITLNNDLNLKSLIEKNPSKLAMGLDFGNQKIYTKNGIYNFDQAKNKEIFGSYKPWPQHTFFDQMKEVIKKPVQIISDFEDSRGSLQEVLFDKKLNVFCYNRKRGIGREILWQRAGFFVPNEHLGFCNEGKISDSIDFKDKINKIYWRGALSGSNWIDNKRRDSVFGIKSLDDFFASKDNYSRIKAVIFSEINKEICDFKLTCDFSKKILQNEYKKFHSSKVSKSEILQYKYILCPNGNDVSTQFYWVIGSNSVAFKEDCEYEIVPDFYLKPWIHYIPISKGLTDLKEKFDFIENNPDIALRIINNANQAYLKIIDGTEWKEAEFKVLDKLGYL